MIISTNYVLIAVISFILSLTTVYVISRVRNPRLVAPDVHKPYRVLVPKIGGVSILIAMSAATVFAYLINDLRLFALGLVTITVGLIGLADDLRGLPVSVRVFLPIVPSLIIPAVMHGYIYIILIGHVHNFFVVAFLSMLAVTVMANAVNMLDVMNGIVPVSTLMIITVSGIISYMVGFSYALPATVVLVLMVLPLAIFNWYPARVFNGNVGSYALGAMMGAFMVLYNAGTQGVISALPYIINGFLIVITARGFRPRETLKRPVIVNDGVIHANKIPGSPITLVKLIVMRKPKTEKEVVNDILLIFLITSLISLSLLFIV
ncbi:MAG: glycosyl hydrolase family 4 [Vulcanisaeta sp.]|jgi:UDP-N-acetylglucosamine--dolichyl-phosphate N-acetylglucosaminephosphotransferase|uniref:Glycosyl transferase family 4 n=1 Tax=Vulcanisaeta moutnovskia (strain 768-28) TaxID=985053 RepID=F0QWD6_VULM7|nr:glycosyl hydrolase family 4 [Vulcanisaeta moutnovskia]ADY00984.1 glycosyl transferase family 4 [Vulcanisaeta moutnovskia 768-28]